MKWESTVEYLNGRANMSRQAFTRTGTSFAISAPYIPRKLERLAFSRASTKHRNRKRSTNLSSLGRVSQWIPIRKLGVFGVLLTFLIFLRLCRSDDERWKLKNGLPSLKRLTKKFICQDAQGVYCRISAQPCRYIQRGEYKYTNFVRHFRTEHTAEATEAGFFRDHSEATEQESVNGTVEQEDSDTDM